MEVILIMVMSTEGKSEDLYVNATFDNVFLPGAMSSAFFLNLALIWESIP